MMCAAAATPLGAPLGHVKIVPSHGIVRSERKRPFPAARSILLFTAPESNIPQLEPNVATQVWRQSHCARVGFKRFVKALSTIQQVAHILVELRRIGRVVHAPLVRHRCVVIPARVLEGDAEVVR